MSFASRLAEFGGDRRDDLRRWCAKDRFVLRGVDADAFAGFTLLQQPEFDAQTDEPLNESFITLMPASRVDYFGENRRLEFGPLRLWNGAEWTEGCTVAEHAGGSDHDVATGQCDDGAGGKCMRIDPCGGVGWSVRLQDAAQFQSGHQFTTGCVDSQHDGIGSGVHRFGEPPLDGLHRHRIDGPLDREDLDMIGLTIGGHDRGGGRRVGGDRTAQHCRQQGQFEHSSERVDEALHVVSIGAVEGRHRGKRKTGPRVAVPSGGSMVDATDSVVERLVGRVVRVGFGAVVDLVDVVNRMSPPRYGSPLNSGCCACGW